MDTIYSSFVNFKTAYGQTQNPDFLRIREEGVALVNEEYEAKEAEIVAKYQTLIEGVDLAQAEAAASTGKAEIAQLKTELKTTLAELKANYKVELSIAKREYAETLVQIKAAVKEEYDAMIAKEKEDLKAAIATNHDRDAIRARKASYDAFKETLPATRLNDLNGRVNAASFEFDTIKSGIVSRYSRAKYDAISECEEKVKAITFAMDPVGHYTKEMNAKLKELSKEKENALIHADLLFFFNYSGLYQVLPKDITTKIIQGLGSKVFTKTFRINIPHDAYVVSDEGIEFNVIDVVDYGSNKFYRCEGNMFGEVVTIYVKHDGRELNGTIHVLPNLEKTEIYETALNIRLY